MEIRSLQSLRVAYTYWFYTPRNEYHAGEIVVMMLIQRSRKKKYIFSTLEKEENEWVLYYSVALHECTCFSTERLRKHRQASRNIVNVKRCRRVEATRRASRVPPRGVLTTLRANFERAVTKGRRAMKERGQRILLYLVAFACIPPVSASFVNTLRALR